MIFDKNDTEVATLKKYVNFENKDILEFCCGTSMYANRLPQNYKSYLGVDIDENSILKARELNKNSKAKFACLNISDLQLSDKKDIVVGTLALHEIDIKEQGLALLNLINITKKDGLLIILDPILNKNCFQELWNVVYREFLGFEHDFTVKQAKLVIDKSIKDNLVTKEVSKNISLPIVLENREEIYEMFLECSDFKDLFQDKLNVSKLKAVVDKYLEENKITNLIYDKLKLTILRRL